MDIRTRCIHGSAQTYNQTGAISVPIYQSATFAHPGIGESTGFDYSRLQNPTRDHLEKTMAGLDGGTDALAFSSGMAAIAALMELFSPGDHIIASDDLYGGSYRLFRNISEKNGLTIDFINTSDVARIQSIIRPDTAAIFIETPSNPMMQVADIAGISKITKQYKLLLVIDNTFLTPYFQKPLDLGADVVVYSGTKYLGGHNDTLAGFLVAGDPALAEKLRFIYKTTGACLSPLDSWLIIRGLKTLAVRMDRQQESALRLAHWLTDHPNIRSVHYAGLPSHPDYDLSCRQSSGFGAMISFVTKNEALAKKALSRIQLIQYAESLGGVETLITYPVLQTHADIPDNIRTAKGISGNLLRLSVGLEAVEDLETDLASALED